MKNLAKCFILLSFVGVMTACGTEKDVAKTTAAIVEPMKAEVKPAEVAKMTDDEIKRFTEYAPNLRGGSFLKIAKIEGSKALIEYAKFSEYKGNTTEKGYNDYWLTGDAIRKVLMEESVRLLREFPTLNEVKIVTPPFEGKKLTTTLDRKSAEEYYKVNLKEMSEDKENKIWKEKISNVQFTEQGRDNYEKKFIKIETP